MDSITFPAIAALQKILADIVGRLTLIEAETARRAEAKKVSAAFFQKDISQ